MLSKKEKIQKIKNIIKKYDVQKKYVSDSTGVSRATLDRMINSDNPKSSQSTVDSVFLFLETEYPSVKTIEEPSFEYITNSNGNSFKQLGNGKYRISVPLIPFKAYASYIEIYEDEYQTIDAFETKYFIVDRIGRGRYASFVTANESMNGGSINDTPGGAEVLVRELGQQHWLDGFKNTLYGWIIISVNGIYHKDIIDTETKGKIICSSRNPSPEFQDFELILDDVHSIWKVIKREF